MTITEASAPGKVILFGEHAVVYGQPAIAAPVNQVRATATIVDRAERGTIIDLPDLKKQYLLSQAGKHDPFAQVVRLVRAQVNKFPALHITIYSDIPIASGLGSGAATATALIRALGQHLDIKQLNRPAQISALTYQIEQIHHGTPSGIDNTVVAYEKLVYFVKKQPKNQITPFQIANPMNLLIADTGINNPTKKVVAGVRRNWKADPKSYDNLFERCGQIAWAARKALKAGDMAQVGDLMNHNQVLLHKIGVSSPELERLIANAIVGGVYGAKLSGAGQGGNMIALVPEHRIEAIRGMLLQAGAKRVLATTIGA